MAVALVVVAVVVAAATTLILRLFDVLWLKPKRIRSKIVSQGITGPKPSSLLHGNVPEINTILRTSKQPAADQSLSASSATCGGDGGGAGTQPLVNNISHTSWIPFIFPYLQQWSQQYGPIYTYSTGSKQHLYAIRTDLVKDMSLHKSLNIGKPTYIAAAFKPMLGNGIIKANGHEWANQRKLIAPQLFPDKLKGMVGLMVESTMSLIKSWECRTMESSDGAVDMIIDPDLRSVSADIISKACFGSSFSEGKHIFAKLAALQAALSKPNLLFGLTNFFRFLPTKGNREVWRLRDEIEELIVKLVKDRQEQIMRQRDGKCDRIEKDLLHMILENDDAATDGNNESGVIFRKRNKTMRYIVDNCKNIYFAGYESTAITTSWTLMLLALYPEWQERVRSEIFQVCGDQISDICSSLESMNTFSKLKTVTMVIQESLRLYGPAVIMSREVFEEMKLGGVVVPKGAHIWQLSMELHRDTKNWGADANEFKPERFVGGVKGACKHPQAYMPFGFGTRLCVGQNFAMMELKIMLCLILSKFSVTLSPSYVHSPVYKMLLIPEHGVRLIVRSL